jgi:hypothetical protein
MSRTRNKIFVWRKELLANTWLRRKKLPRKLQRKKAAQKRKRFNFFLNTSGQPEVFTFALDLFSSWLYNYSAYRISISEVTLRNPKTCFLNVNRDHDAG